MNVAGKTFLPVEHIKITINNNTILINHISLTSHFFLFFIKSVCAKPSLMFLLIRGFKRVSGMLALDVAEVSVISSSLLFYAPKAKAVKA